MKAQSFVIVLCTVVGCAISQDACSVSKDLVFLFDVSTSLGLSNYYKILDFAVGIVRSMKVDEYNYRVGALSFSDSGVVQFNLNTYFHKLDVMRAIQNISYSQGSTAMVEALTMMTEMFNVSLGDRPEAPNVAIMLTDGASKDGAADEAAQAAKHAGISIYCIGLTTTELDMEEITAIASTPSSRYAFLVEDFDETLTMVSADIILAEGRDLACDPGPPIEVCEGTKADVVFAIEGSSQVSEFNFRLMLDFVRDTLSQINVGDDTFRIGIIIYSTGASTYIHLNDFNSNSDVAEALDNIKRPLGRRDTASALNMMANVAFTESYGDRKDAPNIGILITTGASDYTPETIRKADSVHSKGIELFVIAIGGTNNEEEISAMATDPDDLHIYRTSNFVELQSLGHQPVREMMCYLPDCQGREVDMIFILDTSGDLIEEDFRSSKALISSVIGRLHISDIYARVGLITFGNHSVAHLDLDGLNTKEDVLFAVDLIDHIGGARNTADAISEMRSMFSSLRGGRDNAPQVAILLTSTPSAQDNVVQEIAEAKASGIHIMVVATGSQTNMEELHMLASSPDYVFTSQSPQTMYNLTGLITQNTCTIKACIYAIDLVFVLDNSGSITNDNFKQMIDFVASLVNELYVDGGTVRVALATFGPTASVVFQLNSYSSRLSMVNAFKSIVPMTEGSTNIENALNLLINEVFVGNNGDRDDVPNVAIFVSDARATENKNGTRPAADRVKATGVEIFSIGVGKELLSSELEYIASEPKETHLAMIDDFDALGSLEEEVVGQAVCGNLCDGLADICFLVDTSGSIGIEDFAKVRQFINDIIDEIAIGGARNARVSVVTFGDDASVVFYLDNYMNKKSLMKAVNLIQYSGGATNIASALELARTAVFKRARGDRDDAPNIAVLFTDGFSSRRAEDTLPQAVAARHASIELFVVGAGPSVDHQELRGIASEPSESHLWIVQSGITELSTLRIAKNVSKAICNDIDDCTSSTCQNGAVCRDLLHGTSCECSDDYSGETCSRRCTNLVDVVFVVDVSGSIGKYDFQKVRDYLRAVVIDLRIGVNAARVGVVTFGSTALIEFHLDRYDNKSAVLKAIDDIEYRGGYTDIASALQLMRLSMFSAERARGSEENIYKIGVIISDGTPTVNQDDVIPQARRARQDGIHLFAIGCGTEIKLSLLRSLASDPDDRNVIVADSFDTLLSQARVKIVDPICNEANECASNPCANNGTCVNGVVGYECLCSAMYAGVNCEKVCNRSMDIVFMVDSSGSIKEEDFYKQLYFLQGVVNELEFNNNTRVGLLTFADHAVMHFRLDTYTTKKDVLSAIGAVPYKKGATNTADALKLMRTIFVSSSTRRVSKYAVLLTDGTPTVRKGQEIGEARTAKAGNIRIISIGVGSNIAREKLNELSSDPDKDVFMTPDFAELDQLRQKLGDKFCNGET